MAAEASSLASSQGPASGDGSELAVELVDIWKRFPGVIANAGANLAVRRGTVHAVLGENGAGKTTLMNVLAGVYRPESGQVRLDGVDQSFASPAAAISAGVVMVHQEFRLIPTFTVAENVALGQSPRLLAKRSIEESVGALAEQFGLATEPAKEVWQLSMGERQRVEILKALWRNARVLILDEPTAVLTPAEATELGDIVGAMAADGRSIIFISHKLDEVTEFCDEATVLRGGATVAASLPVETLDGARLAELMVGEATEVSVRRQRGGLAAPDELIVDQGIGEPLLEVAGARMVDTHGVSVVDDVSLTVRAGEIVGVAGVAGNGQRPLADAIAGLERLDGGKVTLSGTDITSAEPLARQQAGLAYVPEDRLGVGLAPKLNVIENAIMRSYRRARNGPFIDRGAAARSTEDLINRFNVKVGQLEAPMAGLSGGNLQRLLVGRELAEAPQVLVAAQPTRGLDVQGVAAIQEILVEQSRQGVGILLISEDLEELLALSDRLLVMHEGAVAAEFDPDEVTRAEVGAAMAGAA